MNKRFCLFSVLAENGRGVEISVDYMKNLLVVFKNVGQQLYFTISKLCVRNVSPRLCRNHKCLREDVVLHSGFLSMFPR